MNRTFDNMFSHLNESGEASMVDVADKADTVREARAQAVVQMNQDCYTALKSGSTQKGDVLATARIAGIQAAKQTASLIPLCHPLMLSKVSIDFVFNDQAQQILVLSHCRLTGKTGVEMEALCAANISALTIYDMCKAIDKGMTITDVQLLAKKGGKSGDWLRGQ